ncbi:tRNA (N6-threonylcarbamoyladenosine(37)-N6)-methyltransferase TrmO [Microbispora hainanensis]|jgi:tRNA-Thr(GGU) m(6)t(6)A37 methyltransferase TsaA|uniref:tRNA (N6-threonylcarbamoyladenosine(37)-N6)-methyltransferase TrmO n=1 Tax=Microbispora hainanensis TaxID=568844 RepID=A0ABZ1SX10_9ACTN|nr:MULTISPECIES: tRNA (N6-threonylcarbamoyladenosine(37)-N6)-methyltransferase TrmO [Microbispora]
MSEPMSFTLRPVGVVRSTLTDRTEAPRQGREGAPDAWLEIDPAVGEALDGMTTGDEVLVLTWFHQADRETLRVHPRGETSNPLAGVFATRSPDRPNPIGLHRVTVLETDPARGLRVHPLEAIDGTPVIDIKPVLDATER